MGAMLSTPEEVQWDNDNGAVYKVYSMAEMVEQKYTIFKSHTVNLNNWWANYGVTKQHCLPDMARSSYKADAEHIETADVLLHDKCESLRANSSKASRKQRGYKKCLIYYL